MKSLYSIAICPPEDVVQKVAEYKKRLADAIGWYRSKNSEAHITFNLFSADERILAIWETYMRWLSFLIAPFPVTLDSTDHFKNGAFFLKPNQESLQSLREFMNYFNLHSPLSAQTQNNPHVSIGRGLSEKNLQIAKEMIRNINLKFLCDNLAIRKYNPDKQQYEVISRTYFNS